MNSPAIYILLSILNAFYCRNTYSILEVPPSHLHLMRLLLMRGWGGLPRSIRECRFWRWMSYSVMCSLGNCFISEKTHSLTLANTTHFLLQHLCEFSFNEGSFFNTEGSLFPKQFILLFVSSKDMIDYNYIKLDFNMSYLSIGVTWLFLRKCEQIILTHSRRRINNRPRGQFHLILA